MTVAGWPQPLSNRVWLLWLHSSGQQVRLWNERRHYYQHNWWICVKKKTFKKPTGGNARRFISLWDNLSLSCLLSPLSHCVHLWIIKLDTRKNVLNKHNYCELHSKIWKVDALFQWQGSYRACMISKTTSRVNDQIFQIHSCCLTIYFS